MIKINLGMLTPFLLFASKEENHTILYTILTAIALTIVLFFWGIYKAIKTQKTIYMLALLPFVVLLVSMFFIR